jgi:hypothetical protein
VVTFLVGRGAVVQPMPDSSQRWPSGSFRVHLPNVSTRGLGLTVEAGRFTITIPTLACAEDRDLAFLLAAEVAQAVEDAWELDGVSVPNSHLIPLPGASAVAFTNDCAEVEQRARNAVITLPGPNRDFHVGPRLVDDLGTDPAAWASAMRRVQYGIVEEAPRERRGSDHGNVSVVAVQPGTTAVLSWSDLVALGPDEDALVVPFARFVELTAGRSVPLDERSVVIGALSHAEWDSLLERARPFALDDLVHTPASSHPTLPMAMQMATPDDEDSPVGPPIVRSPRSASPTLTALTSSKWALPVFGGLLFTLAVVLGTAFVFFLAVWLGH